MGKSEHTLSKQDTVCTPEAIWRPIVETLGPIWLDPCSHPASTVPAQIRVLLPELYWTHPTAAPPAYEECGDHDVHWGDGLKLAWKGADGEAGGLVYWNAPYSELPKKAWVKKGLEADESVGFVPVRTATGWWQKEIVYFDAITFLQERVTHDNVFNKEGEPVDDPSPFGQALVYHGPRLDLWLPTARQLGWTVLGAKR